MLVIASEEDEAGSYIGKVQFAASSAVVHNAAAAVDVVDVVAVASSHSWQDRAAAGHIDSFVDTGMKTGPSLLSRYTVPTDDDLQMRAVPSSLVVRLPSGANRRIGARSHLADASILGEAGSGRPIVRGKDV